MSQLTFAARLEALTPISGFIADAAAQAGLDETTTWQLQLAVDEAATNIIQHAYDADTDGSIMLACAHEMDRFVVQIRDWGRGFDPQSVPRPDLLSPLEERQIGGLGIYLMTRLMDEVTFAFDPDAGNLLTLVKYMAHTPAPSALMVLPLAGRLDAQAAPRMREQARTLIDQGAVSLIADLSNAYFLSSSGLRALLLIRKEVMNRGGELYIVAATPHVSEVFDLTGFAQVFTLYPTVEEARAAFAQSQA